MTPVHGAGARARLSDHVVLVSIDGLRPQIYRDERWPAPVLHEFARSGAIALAARSVFPALTYPPHTTIVTGALPVRHSIIHNEPFGPIKQSGCWFWEASAIAYKQIFPALQALLSRHNLRIPIIGVARSGWNFETLKARARESVEKHGGVDEAAFAQFSAWLRYVDGDYNDPGTFTRLRKALDGISHPLHYLAMPPSAFGTAAEGLAKSGCAANARVVVEKPFGCMRAILDDSYARPRLLTRPLAAVPFGLHRMVSASSPYKHNRLMGWRSLFARPGH